MAMTPSAPSAGTAVGGGAAGAGTAGAGASGSSGVGVAADVAAGVASAAAGAAVGAAVGAAANSVVMRGTRALRATPRDCRALEGKTGHITLCFSNLTRLLIQ